MEKTFTFSLVVVNLRQRYQEFPVTSPSWLKELEKYRQSGVKLAANIQRREILTPRELFQLVIAASLKRNYYKYVTQYKLANLGLILWVRILE